MTDVEQHIREDAARWRSTLAAPPDLHESLAIITREQPKGHPRRTRVLATIAAAAVVLIATGVSVWGTRSRSPTPVGAASRASQNRLTLRVYLDRSSAPADGTPIHGYVIADNTLGHRVSVAHACGRWTPWVALTNRTVTPEFKFFDGGTSCATGYIPTGTTRYPVTISTRYPGCSERRNQTTPTDPLCVGSHGLPPLPPGAYRTETDLAGTVAVAFHEDAATVTLLPTPTNP